MEDFVDWAGAGQGAPFNDLAFGPFPSQTKGK